MRKEKIVQTVFNNILDHVMTSVLCEENREGSQIPVGKRFLIYLFQYFDPIGCILCIEPISELLIKKIIQEVLQYLFSQIGTTTFIPQNVAQSRTSFYNLFTVKIA